MSTELRRSFSMSWMLYIEERQVMENKFLEAPALEKRMGKSQWPYRSLKYFTEAITLSGLCRVGYDAAQDHNNGHRTQCIMQSIIRNITFLVRKTNIRTAQEIHWLLWSGLFKWASRKSWTQFKWLFSKKFYFIYCSKKPSVETMVMQSKSPETSLMVPLYERAHSQNGNLLGSLIILQARQKILILTFFVSLPNWCPFGNTWTRRTEIKYFFDANC